MSAPPSCVDDAPVMPTMVSRLPKFGSRTKSTTSASSGAQTVPTPTANAATFTGATASSTRLTNGFYHHPGPAGVNGGVTAPSASAKQNGFIRVPTSFSVKWRKENGMTTDDGGANAEPEWRGGRDGNVGQNRPGNNINQYYYQRQQASPVVSQHDTKKTTASSAGMGRGFGQSVSSSSSPSPQSSPRTLPVSKSGTLGSKPSPTASRLTNGTKQALNALPGSRSGTSGSLSRPQSFPRPGGPGPGSRTGSPFQKKPPASRSLSSDSIGSAPTVRLMESDRFRSRSLNQVRQQPSLLRSPSSSSSSSLPRSPTVTRPYSVTRPAVRGPAQAPPTGRQTPEGGGGGVKASGRSGLVPPSALKKPLLPNLGPASKPSGISYKLSRPSLIKQARPFRVTPARVSGGDPDVNLGATSAERPPATGNSSAESSPEAPETEGLPTEPVSQAEVSILGETLEDMSLSSTSSLDRDDTSQEYMDDFDNLGIGDIGIMLLPSKNDEDDSGLDQSCARFDKLAVNGVAEATGLCFLEDGLDWAGVQLSGEGAEHRLTQLGCRRRTSHQEYHEQGGSSLDLSPSDSCGSGGTYMWDEEGLEPLGGAVTTASINTTNSSTTHHIGSFDSDVNSIDMMNNLDSCDLEDDDLMLDAEDVSLDSDGDRTSNMAQWRMRQLCWGTQDVHTDHESDLQCYKLTEDPGNKRTDGDFVLDLCPSRTPCLPPALGLDVEELADDCSAVRSQLEHLQRLLLQEDDVDEDTLTTDTLSPEAEDSSHSSDSQVQALLQEVQQLREDLRSRDRTIAQLTLQLTFPTVTARCRCQETTGRMDRHTQMSVTERESVASQTPWTEHKSQIFHSSGRENQEPLTDRVPPPPPLAQAPPPAQAPPSARPCPEIPAVSLPDDMTEEREDDGKRPTKEKRGAHCRSLKLPQPSKLCLFLSQTSAAARPPQTRASRQPSTPHDPESEGSSVLKPALDTSGLSRLPKPKSH
uniref:Serine-rich coiled-coil domain-containing protein 2-like n=1 Tax=Scophthalmus maximus TaxID=52904 RepID=A0A8D3BKP8_SCOMX